MAERHAGGYPLACETMCFAHNASHLALDAGPRHDAAQRGMDFTTARPSKMEKKRLAQAVFDQASRIFMKPSASYRARAKRGALPLDDGSSARAKNPAPPASPAAATPTLGRAGGGPRWEDEAWPKAGSDRKYSRNCARPAAVADGNTERVKRYSARAVTFCATRKQAAAPTQPPCRSRRRCRCI